eukprot:640591-Pleurochrysis_carterae.AAC.2
MSVARHWIWIASLSMLTSGIGPKSSESTFAFVTFYFYSTYYVYVLADAMLKGDLVHEYPTAARCREHSQSRRAMPSISANRACEDLSLRVCCFPVQNAELVHSSMRQQLPAAATRRQSLAWPELALCDSSHNLRNYACE